MHLGVVEVLFLLGHCMALVGSLLLVFWDNLFLHQVSKSRKNYFLMLKGEIDNIVLERW
jgi:sulfite exporter TauE/SafE